jgi:hypothetical protein
MNKILKSFVAAAALCGALSATSPAVARANIPALQFMQKQACHNYALAKRELDAANGRLAAAQAQLAAPGSDKAAAQQAIADAQAAISRARNDLYRAQVFYEQSSKTLQNVGGASVCTI